MDGGAGCDAGAAVDGEEFLDAVPVNAVFSLFVAALGKRKGKGMYPGFSASWNFLTYCSKSAALIRWGGY